MNADNEVSIVVAVARDNVIGKDNALPWRIPEDLRRFRQITTGGALIMGRRTHDSIGKPLPQRLNIVVTRAQKNIEGCQSASSPEAALDIARDSGKKIFIIGGEQIYRQLLPQTTAIYLTDLRAAVAIENGDATFPAINENEWREVKREPMLEVKGDFVCYRRADTI